MPLFCKQVVCIFKLHFSIINVSIVHYCLTSNIFAQTDATSLINKLNCHFCMNINWEENFHY